MIMASDQALVKCW